MCASPDLSSPRAFGSARDLEFDFALAERAGRAELVTGLLAACAGGGDADHWWGQPLGARIAALLGVLQRSLGGDNLDVAVRCGRSGCAQRFEIALPYAALPAPQQPAVGCLLPGAREVRLRAATGADLKTWRDAAPPSGEAALAMMIDSLLLGGSAGIDDAPALAEAIAALDPLVAFEVACHCPACGAAQEFAIDLEAQALSRLGALQRALLREVHVFASHYGWTESDVLALAPARRARYLELIESG